MNDPDHRYFLNKILVFKCPNVHTSIDNYKIFQ